MGDACVGLAPCGWVGPAAGDDEEREEGVLAAECDGRAGKGGAEGRGSIVGLFGGGGNACGVGCFGCLLQHCLLKVKVAVEVSALGVAG